MGACLSCRLSSKLNNIRVVHLNGYVEDLEQPVSASQVIGNPHMHFVGTSVQLLSSSSNPLLIGDTQLQPGQVYFVLPYSILQADVSPLDLACLAKRLTTIAKTRNKSLKASPLLSLSTHTVWSSPCRDGVAEQIGVNRMTEGRSPCRVQPWKPILETIREKSFNRRSDESDLQDYI